MRKVLLTLGAAAGIVIGATPAVAADKQGGCKANGQAVAAAAHGLHPFGQFVRTQAPINDDVAAFKEALC